jgi:hypothetical protein
MCTSLQKKGIMFRMVPDQFFSTLIIVRKNLKNPLGRLKQRKTLVLRIWSGDYPPPPRIWGRPQPKFPMPPPG